jgi:hypothetical protein
MVAWASRLVFSPTVWLGIAIAGVSGVLFLAAAQLRRRGVGTRGRPPTSKRSAGADAELPARPSRGAAKAPVDDDMADIEAILKKHGIS